MRDVPDQTDPHALIDGCVAQDMDALQAPGAALAVMQDGQITYTKGYGFRHLGEATPVDPETQFRSGSVQKMQTAAAIMQLVEAGKLTLEDPITKWIPEFQLKDPQAAGQITVRHLLTHSSGIPDLLSGFDVKGPTDDKALATWSATLQDVRLFAPPGSFWNYSNPGYSLAGLVVERASGMPYHTYMSRLWATAGMTSTTLLPAEVLARGNYSYGHSRDLLTREPVEYAPDAYDNWWAAPAGFGFTTVGDMVRFVDLLMGGPGELVRADSAAQMQQRQVGLDMLPDAGYGYGVFVDKFGDTLIRSHGGNINGWGAYLLWVPSRRFAVATLGNTDGSLINSAYCAMVVQLGLDVPQPLDLTTDPSTWSRYSGNYDGLDTAIQWDLQPPRRVMDLPLTVSQHGDNLRLTFPTIMEFPTATVPVSRALLQAYLDVFLVDFNDNGLADGQDLDVTFIDDRQAPDKVKWIRNRFFVGTYASPLAPPSPSPIFLPLAMRVFEWLH